MKNLSLYLLTLSTVFCHAQNEINFEFDGFENQLLSYQSKQNPNVSKKDFEYGSMILNETKSAIENNPENFNLADYFNVLSALITLKESTENIKIAFEKFKNAKGSCEYFLFFENSIKTNSKFDIIRADYNKKLEECKSNPIKKNKFDLVEYSKTNDLELALVQKIIQVDIDDQKFRSTKSKELLAKQQKLDSQNQQIINSLYNKHKTYIGRSLVGEKFESVMWAVIQHSNIEMMEKYLPIIQEAVKRKELDIAPFKMMIDRIYSRKEGYQIFGSQQGVKLANKKTRKEVIEKYRLE